MPVSANRAKAECPAGHPYDDANTYVTKSGFRQCRACKREGVRRHDLTAQRHHSRLMRVYGIGLPELEEMYAAQGGVCAVCAAPGELRGKKRGGYDSLVVDHCHDSGRVRGLLCHRCNKVLGLVADNGNHLSLLKSYLDGSPSSGRDGGVDA